MHLPAPSYSSTSGMLRTVALNSLRRASQMGSSLMCAMTNLPPPFSAVASRRIASTSSIELAGRKFAVAEGANLNVAENWSNAHLLRGQQKMKAGRYPEALADFQTAATIPANLPGTGGRGGSGAAAEVAYWSGVAQAALGDRQKALESWNRAGAPAQAGPGGRGGPRMGGGAQTYYQGLCLEKLGQNDKAKALFQGLVESGRS